MKEIIEKAAKEYVENFAMSIKSERELGFKDGANWQSERMYSEEEVYNMIIDLLKRKQVGQIIDYGDIHEWFEQYYKIK